MQYKETFVVLEPKIGREAVELGILNRRLRVGGALFALAAVVILRAIPGQIPTIVLTGLMTIVLLIAGAYVRTSVRLAGLISQRYKTKVAWYSVPGVVPVKPFDRWLQSLGCTPNK